MAGVAVLIAGFAATIGRHANGAGYLYLGLILVPFTGLFSFLVFGVLDTQERVLAETNAVLAEERDRLAALREATWAITTVFDFDILLQQVVDVSRTLLGARYAALAVLQDENPARIERFFTSGISRAERDRIGDLPEGHGLLGEVIKHKQPLRVENIQRHPYSSGFPPNHPAMETFLGIPLLYQGQVLGHLYLTEKSGGFTAKDQDTAELFARQAAVVISNARLYREMERLVALNERERIGRELHDGVLQTLYGITLELDNLVDTAQHLDPGVARDLLNIADTVAVTMTEIRHFIQSLGSGPVDFVVGIRDMLHRLGAYQAVDLAVEDEGYQEMPPELVHDVILSVQEAVSNARRHGGAGRVDVRFRTEPSGYVVEVADAGRGFNPHVAQPVTRHGLANMQQRMGRWHGTMTIESREGAGTRVRFWVPRNPRRD